MPLVVFHKKSFSKISQNLQKNTCDEVSFLINFIKKFLPQENQVFVYPDYIFFLPLMSWIKTNYAHLNPVSVNSVDIGATYRPGIVGT